MAGEFDFEPFSEAEIADLANVQDEWGYITTEGLQRMARELRAWRAAGRAWVGASDMGDLSRILPAEQQLRAFVAHVGEGE